MAWIWTKRSNDGQKKGRGKFGDVNNRSDVNSGIAVGQDRNFKLLQKYYTCFLPTQRNKYNIKWVTYETILHTVIAP